MKKLLLFLLLTSVCLGDIEISEDVRWYNSDRTFYFTISASESMTETVTYIFPPADAVSGGLALLSDGSGVMSWGVPTTSAGHKLLGDGVHTDAATDSVVRGDIIVGNAATKWDRLAIGAANTFLKSDGTDIDWSLLLVTAPITLTAATIGFDDAAYSLIDGTRAFTGVVGGITPTANNHLVIKEYVDTSVAGLHFDMFFDDLDSGIDDPVSANDYLGLRDMDTGEAATTSTGDALAQGDDQEVISYISSASLPFVEIQPGLINIHFHARKNNIGQKDSIVFGKLYHRADDGTETLMATTEDSAELTNSVVEYNLHGNVASSVAFISTDRLLLKIRADVQSSGGGNAQIEITQEGVFDSRVSSLVDTDVLSQLFVRQDGSKELTDNWPIGGFDITNIGNLGIGTDSPDQDLEVRGVSPIIRVRATGGIGNAASYVEFGRTTGGNWVRTGFVGDAISGNEDIYLVAEDSNLKLGDSSSNAVLTLSGGNVTATNDIKAQTFSIGSGSINETELTFLDGAIAGTASPSKALIVNSGKSISGLATIGTTRINIDTLSIDQVGSDMVFDNGSGDMQFTNEDDISITSAAENIFLTLGDDAGIKKVIIRDDNEATVATIDSDGVITGTTFTDGIMSISGGDITGAAFYPRTLRQGGEPANGTGATQIDDEEQLIWIDTNDSNKVYLMFNDNTNTQVVKIQLQ